MLDIEMYITDELSKCKCSEYQINQFIEQIHPLLIKPRLLDTQKVAGWLAERNLAYKNNPIAWLKKVFIEELNKGTFDKVERHCAIHPFLVELNKRKIAVLENADAYLSTMFDYLINNDIITERELIEFNNKALDYLASQNKTTNDFIYLWKKSKVSKERNIDWATIDDLADQLVKKHIELLKELEK